MRPTITLHQRGTPSSGSFVTPETTAVSLPAPPWTLELSDRSETAPRPGVRSPSATTTDRLALILL